MLSFYDNVQQRGQTGGHEDNNLRIWIKKHADTIKKPDATVSETILHYQRY